MIRAVARGALLAQLVADFLELSLQRHLASLQVICPGNGRLGLGLACREPSLGGTARRAFHVECLAEFRVLGLTLIVERGHLLEVRAQLLEGRGSARQRPFRFDPPLPFLVDRPPQTFPLIFQGIREFPLGGCLQARLRQVDARLLGGAPLDLEVVLEFAHLLGLSIKLPGEPIALGGELGELLLEIPFLPLQVLRFARQVIGGLVRGGQTLCEGGYRFVPHALYGLLQCPLHVRRQFRRGCGGFRVLGEPALQESMDGRGAAPGLGEDQAVRRLLALGAQAARHRGHLLIFDAVTGHTTLHV